MQDRETALKEQENAREWQAIAYGDHPATWAALAYYRERGWPVDANTFPERDRCENRIFAFKAGYAAALASPLSAPPQEPTGDSPQADVTCEHGTAMDVHCCNCHSGFIFDVNHECPSPELTWREAVEQALGVANDPENHTPSWAFDVVMAAREIGNAPSPASPQAEELRAANVANLREMVGMAGRHRETLLAVRECILALSPGHRTGYDWNADPLFLTLKEGRALKLIDVAIKATPASPQAETPIQTLCKNCMQSERFIAPDGSTLCPYCGFVQPAPVSPRGADTADELTRRPSLLGLRRRL